MQFHSIRHSMCNYLFNVQLFIQHSIFYSLFNFFPNIQLFIQYSNFYSTFNNIIHSMFDFYFIINFVEPSFFWSVKKRKRLRAHNWQIVTGNMKSWSFLRCGRRRKDHKMEENLLRLSHYLNQVSEVVQQLASATSNSVSNSAQTTVGTSGGMTSVSQAVSRAPAMMHQSTSRGLYLCLGVREHLRASSSTNSAYSNSKRPESCQR